MDIVCKIEAREVYYLVQEHLDGIINHDIFMDWLDKYTKKNTITSIPYITNVYFEYLKNNKLLPDDWQDYWEPYEYESIDPKPDDMIHGPKRRYDYEGNYTDE